MTDRVLAFRWTLLLILGAVAVAGFTLWAAEAFPQEHAASFFRVKAVVGAAAVVLTIIHMDRTWESLRSGAQMSRYMTLLFGTTIAGAGSFEQISDGALVELRNIGGMEFLLAVTIAMIWSLREDHRRRCASHSVV